MPIPSPPRKKLSKRELVEVLKGKLDTWIAEGKSAQEAIELLTPRQYDFLIDNDFDPDQYLLTPEQRKNAQTAKRAPRRCSPNGYNKKYPESKQALYNGIAQYLTTQGAEIQPRDKQNFRDLDFTIAGAQYRIVLSNPRK